MALIGNDAVVSTNTSMRSDPPPSEGRKLAVGMDPGKRPPPKQRDVELVNNTARRIRIKKKPEGELILPPFGIWRTTPEMVGNVELDLWKERGLVSERQCASGDQHDEAFEPSSIVGALTILVVSWLITSWAKSWVPIAGGGFVVVIVMGAEARKWNEQRLLQGAPSVVYQLWRAFGMLLVSVTGYGLPAAAVLLQTGTSWNGLLELANTSHGIRSLFFLALFALFVGTAATLPALLFFIFTEQRKRVAKEQFYRDVLRLDPSLRTMNEAETTYQPLITDVFETRRGPLFFSPIVLSTFLLALGWTIAALPTAGNVANLSGTSLELHTLFIPNGSAFTFAFLGSYFFALNMVFRRYVRADLGPKAYSHIAVRIIVASILAWVASQAFGAFSTAASTPAPAEVAAPWVLLLLAFFIGIVPETGLAVMHDLLKSRLVSFFVPSLENKDPLNQLEGVTLYDRARLLEEGIENIENLAHHNLVDLVLRTRIPAPRLVDLVDQAILYLHARDEAEPTAADANVAGATLRRLRSYGIRTATDLQRAMADAKDAPLLTLLGPSDGTPSRVKVIADALSDDEWMPQLTSWREFRKTYERAYAIDEF